MITRSAISALVLLSSAVSLNAATLVEPIGRVLVNRGVGFGPAAAGAPLSAGDRVLVPRGGSARIVYSATCVVTIDGGNTITVASEIPCQPGVGATNYMVPLAVLGVTAGILAYGLQDNDGAPLRRQVSP